MGLFPSKQSQAEGKMYCGSITGQQTRGVACQAAWSSRCRCTEQICQKCPTNFYSINSSYEPLIWRPDAGTCSSRASCCDIFSRTRPSASEALALCVTGSFFFHRQLSSRPPKKDNILCHQCNFAVEKQFNVAYFNHMQRRQWTRLPIDIEVKSTAPLRFRVKWTEENCKATLVLKYLAAHFHTFE